MAKLVISPVGLKLESMYTPAVSTCLHIAPNVPFWAEDYVNWPTLEEVDADIHITAKDVIVSSSLMGEFARLGTLVRMAEPAIVYLTPSSYLLLREIGLSGIASVAHLNLRMNPMTDVTIRPVDLLASVEPGQLPIPKLDVEPFVVVSNSVPIDQDVPGYLPMHEYTMQLGEKLDIATFVLGPEMASGKMAIEYLQWLSGASACVGTLDPFMVQAAAVGVPLLILTPDTGLGMLGADVAALVPVGHIKCDVTQRGIVWPKVDDLAEALDNLLSGPVQ